MLHEVEKSNPEIIESFYSFVRDNIRNGNEMVVEFMNFLKNTKSSYINKTAYPDMTYEESMRLMLFGTFLMLKDSREEKERQKRQKREQKQKQKRQWSPKNTAIDTCDLCP